MMMSIHVDKWYPQNKYIHYNNVIFYVVDKNKSNEKQNILKQCENDIQIAYASVTIYKLKHI
jgi:hypothetical protein